MIVVESAQAVEQRGMLSQTTTQEKSNITSIHPDIKDRLLPLKKPSSRSHSATTLT